MGDTLVSKECSVVMVCDVMNSGRTGIRGDSCFGRRWEDIRKELYYQIEACKCRALDARRAHGLTGAGNRGRLSNLGLPLNFLPKGTKLDSFEVIQNGASTYISNRGLPLNFLPKGTKLDSFEVIQNGVDNNIIRQLKIADEDQKIKSKSQKKELFSYSYNNNGSGYSDALREVNRKGRSNKITNKRYRRKLGIEEEHIRSNLMEQKEELLIDTDEMTLKLIVDMVKYLNNSNTEAQARQRGVRNVLV
ncbi:hypothetical protein Glove_60g125 [Diversispora epigaea]|uniref:Uncharacterized protein n=1 Tax=Diversispora epigaea TaxID=1348612 RepID=A0A397JF12_9GLOM|nr:hypothetical protein Glove_60g125 [Diversispora epigaea]